MNNLGFLFAGFTLAWGVFFAYLWVLRRRSDRLERRLERLESRLQDD